MGRTTGLESANAQLAKYLLGREVQEIPPVTKFYPAPWKGVEGRRGASRNARLVRESSFAMGRSPFLSLYQKSCALFAGSLSSASKRGSPRRGKYSGSDLI